MSEIEIDPIPVEPAGIPDHDQSSRAGDGGRQLPNETTANGYRPGDTSGSGPARKAAIAVGVVLAALIALLALGGGDEAASRSALIGNRVPEVGGVDLDGAPFSIDDLRGQWVVVNFFATWCPPCVVEHPEFVAVSEWGRERGDVEVVSVVFNEPDDEPVRRFFDERGGDWPVVLGSTAAIDFQVSQIPETFIVAPSGQVLAHIQGQTTAAEIIGIVETAEGVDG